MQVKVQMNERIMYSISNFHLFFSFLQTVMFSATFPKVIETLARKILHRPLEIIIGGRSVPSRSITQHVELFQDEPLKLPRLIELLNDWYYKGRILVFADTKEAVDQLFQDLTKYVSLLCPCISLRLSGVCLSAFLCFSFLSLSFIFAVRMFDELQKPPMFFLLLLCHSFRAGFRCLPLHSGIDQADRVSTLEDFKSGERTMLVATSIAARGLDVKNLKLVVNYSCPNHYEDYVHRVGRTVCTLRLLCCQILFRISTSSFELCSACCFCLVL